MLTLNYDGETLNPWTSGLSLRVCSCSLASVSLVLSVDSTLIQLRWRLMFFLLSHHVGDNIIVICLNFRFSYLQLRITTRMLMFAPTWQLIIIMLHELKQQQVCNNYLNCSFARLKQVIICRKKKRVHEQQLQRRLLHRILLLERLSSLHVIVFPPQLFDETYHPDYRSACRPPSLYRLFGVTGNCAACSKLIPAFEMVMRARDNVYHLDCFACQLCRQR